MPTSAFNSTTNRPSLATASTRFSPQAHADYNRNVPMGKFVNTTRGSGPPPFPDISLDDLALEFFSSSSNNENESDGALERKGRPARSASRLGRWAADTASSRRRARSVSKSRGGGGDAVSSSSTSGGKYGISNEAAGTRRRRSLSVARYQISDSESEADSFRNSQNASGQKTTASSSRRLERSRSYKNLLHDGYSNHASVLTDDDSKDNHFGKNGFEKIIREVFADKKSEYPSTNGANSGLLYEAMRKEVRTDLNQAPQARTVARNQMTVACRDDIQSENSETLQHSSDIEEKYASKLEQLEKYKQDLLAESVLEEQGQEVFKVLGEHSDATTLAVAAMPSRARKRSIDSSRISENLIEEAERIFEDFICNVEDADISSFDGERSDGSSTLGGTIMTRDSATMETEPYMTPVEMDGVILPWLQWETSNESFLSGKSKARTPVTPKAMHCESEKDLVACDHQSGYSMSSHGSWSPGIFESPQMGINQDRRDSSLSYFDMAEYKIVESNEDIVFELYRQQSRINSGGLLLCTHALY